MVIRKLFGTAFGGDALTSKAISNTATRSTDEIHEYIENLASLEERTEPPLIEPIATPMYGVGIGDGVFAVETT